METSQMLYLLLTSFARQLPYFLILIVGIVLSFSNRAKFPRAGNMALAGLFILLFTDVIGTVVYLVQIYLPIWFHTSYETVGYIGFAIGFVLSLISALGLGLVTYAIWTDRNK